MQIQRRTYQLCLALCGALALLTGAWWFLPTESQSSPSQGIGLRAPAFINNVAQAASNQIIAAEADFLAQEAGISAYMNTGNEIDLSKTEKYFRNIVKQTDDYIIGSVTPLSYKKLTEFEERRDVQVYIHREGWIVAYLLANQSVAIIIDWPAYKSSGLNGTILDKEVRRIASGSSGSSGDIYYYDFRYPDAKNLMLIANMEQADRQWDNFKLEIPSTFIIFEASWSHVVYDAEISKLKINNDESSEIKCNDCWELSAGRTDLKPQFVHKISIYHDPWHGVGGTSYSGIALIYQEGQ